jgi:MFS family permease
MPQYLANEKHLGFQTTATYLSIWMGCAIFAYYLCGWLCDLFGRRYVIPSFVLPAAILLVVMGYLDTPASLFWVGLILNFLITGSFGAGLGYNTELFPTQIRGMAVGAAFTFGSAGGGLAPAIVGCTTQFSGQRLSVHHGSFDHIDGAVRPARLPVTCVYTENRHRRLCPCGRHRTGAQNRRRRRLRRRARA